MLTTTIEKPNSTKTLKNRKIREKQTKKRREAKTEREEKIRILNEEKDFLVEKNENLEKECKKNFFGKRRASKNVSSCGNEGA